MKQPQPRSVKPERRAIRPKQPNVPKDIERLIDRYQKEDAPAFHRRFGK